MFNPIHGPATPGQGPATADSTEHDSWYNAVAKINGMFKALYTKLEGPISHEVSVIDEEGRALTSEAIQKIAAVLDDLKKRVEALEKLVTDTVKLHV